MSLAPHSRLYGPLREGITPDARAWKDWQGRQRLYIVCEVIKRWASRFDGDVVLALAAGAVSNDSLSRFLRGIAEWCNECEPKTWGGPSAHESAFPERLKDLHELEQALTAVESLNAFATGRIVYYPIDHTQPMAGDNIGVDWEPTDDETELYLRHVLATSLRSADSATQRDESRKLGERLRNLAIQSVDGLHLAMNAPVHTKGGLGLAAIDVAITKQPAGSPKVEIHEEMKQVLHDLQELAHGEDAKSTTPYAWVACVEPLLACWDSWADACLILHGLPRHTKQSKKSRLKRRVACVTQYAYAMRGVDAFACNRFVHVVMCLGTLATRIQTLLVKNDSSLKTLPAGAEAEIHDKINTLDRLVVDDGVLERWQSHFNETSPTVGKTVDVIVTAGDGQDEPWQQGAKRGYLEKAGVLVGSDDARTQQFEKLLFGMQQIAVAVQIPHTLLAGKPMRPKHEGEKLHAAEDWLVNPLAAVLANEPVASPARKAVGSKKRRPRAAAKRKKPKK